MIQGWIWYKNVFFFLFQEKSALHLICFVYHCRSSSELFDAAEVCFPSVIYLTLLFHVFMLFCYLMAKNSFQCPYKHCLLVQPHYNQELVIKKIKKNNNKMSPAVWDACLLTHCKRTLSVKWTNVSTSQSFVAFCALILQLTWHEHPAISIYLDID